MTIIFDFDGTIADSFPFILDYLLKEARHAPLTDAEKDTYRHLSMIGIARRLGIGRLRLPIIFLRGRRAMGGLQSKVEPFDGMPDLIVKLHSAGNQLMILSSNRAATIVTFLRRHGLNKYFTNVYGQIGIFGKAPALRRILKTHKLNLEDCIYIGDELRDVEASKSIGLRCIAVTWGFSSPELLKALKPYALVSTRAELEAALKSANK